MSLRLLDPSLITIEKRTSVMIASVAQSSLCDEDDVNRFGVELMQMIENADPCWIVIDLHRVAQVASSAVGKLIGLHRVLRRHQGCVALCGVHGLLREVLQTAKLIDYFHVAVDVDAAVEFVTRSPTMDESRLVAKPR